MGACVSCAPAEVCLLQLDSALILAVQFDYVSSSVFFDL